MWIKTDMSYFCCGDAMMLFVIVACQPDVNPCFVYANNPAYFSECIENVFTDPPTASCGPCPLGFSGDGISCTGKLQS